MDLERTKKRMQRTSGNCIGSAHCIQTCWQHTVICLRVQLARDNKGEDATLLPLVVCKSK